MNMHEQKIKELFSDEQFVKEPLTKKETSELSDDELEEIAGGSSIALPSRL